MRKVLIILITGILLTACASKEEKALTSYARQQNRACPQQLDSELLLTSYDYDSDANIFTINYASAETSNTIEAMRRSETPLRRIIAQNFHNSDLDELSQLLLEAESVLRLRFIGKITNDTLCIDFTNSDMQEIVRQRDAVLSEKDRFAAMMANENARCPQEVDGDRLVITSVTVDSSFVVVDYRFDPSVYNFAALDSSALVGEFRPMMKESLVSADASEQLKLMKSLGLGMRYRFEADSIAPFSISFLPSEIAGY